MFKLTSIRGIFAWQSSSPFYLPNIKINNKLKEIIWNAKKNKIYKIVTAHILTVQEKVFAVNA